MSSFTEAFVQALLSSAPLTDGKVEEMARLALLDFLATCFAGKDEPQVERLRQALKHQQGPHLLIGFRERSDLYSAPLFNGFLGHVLDFDDVHASVRGHPSVVILPALLALAEERIEDASISAIHFFNAYAVGVEVMARLGLAIGNGHYERGYHNTATLGSIASAAACSYLLRQDEQKCISALSFAATQTGGMRVVSGTDGKPLNAGFAARNGVWAVKLAEAGLAADVPILDGRLGFLQLYGGGDEVPHWLTEGWGEKWQVAEPGLWFKRFACCSAAYHGADAALHLKETYSIKPEEIKEIVALFPPGGDAALVVHRPRNGVEGRFSIEYVLASIFVDGRLTMETFRREKIPPAVQRVMERVRREYSADLPPAERSMPKGRFTVVRVILTSGQVYEQRVDAPKGSPLNPLSISEINSKYLDAVKTLKEEDKAIKLREIVWSMSNEADFLHFLRTLKSVS